MCYKENYKYIKLLGENFKDILDGYFEEFRKKMRKRLRIPLSLVMSHYNYICFIVDVDNTFVPKVKPRKAQLKPFGYEVEVDDVSASIVALLKE